MKSLILLFFLLLSLTSVAQRDSSKKIGGGCDGCELMYVGIPQVINAVDTSAGWHEPGTRLIVTGKVYQRDGRTPAPGVIVYYWQTDSKGLYSSGKGAHQNTHHGHIRGWVKTDGSGAYRIYTSRPAPYPSANEPAHIHVLIKEPKLANEYYIDDLIFDDDVRVLKKKRSGWVPENRGGSGLLRVVLLGKTQIAEHNVVLGLNIPNYPSQDETGPASGLKIGEEQPSFTPFHAWGPDRGTQTCPVCKYGRYHGIVYFVGNRPDWNEIKAWLTFLETESTSRSKYLKAYFVYASDRGFDRATRQKELEQLGKTLNIKNTALTFVPSCDDKASDMYLNRINPAVDNTLVIYRHRVIIDKFINVKPTAATFEKVRERIDATKSEYADLPEPTH